MSLYRFTRVGYYDFKAGDKLWEGFPKWADHAVGFYDMDLIIDRYEYGKMPSVYPKTPTYRHKTGFLPCTFGLAASRGVSFFDSKKYCVRYFIFQRGPHDLHTAVWRKTADSVPCYDPDFDEKENSAYQKITKRIKLGEFSK